jgi:serine kinase of HPr protein (carbohydrate metabolism regulator)
MSLQQVDFSFLLETLSTQFPQLGLKWLMTSNHIKQTARFPYFGLFNSIAPPNIAILTPDLLSQAPDLSGSVIAICCDFKGKIPPIQNILTVLSGCSAQEVYETLHTPIQIACSPHQTYHGTLLNIFDKGVFLVGESGIGKSAAALHLIEKGHKLISDDAPEFIKIQPDKLIGRCPSTISGLIEIRGLGIWQISKLFGDQSIQQQKHLDLAIRLIKPNTMTKKFNVKLQPHYQALNLLGVSIPEIVIEALPGQYLASQIEIAVKGWLLPEACTTKPAKMSNTTGTLICDY